nr:hypothetical protein [Caldimonas brevitalea]
MKLQPYSNGFHFNGHDIACHTDYLPPSAMLLDVYRRGMHLYTTSDIEGWEAECPYGVTGQRLWVRETWMDLGCVRIERQTGDLSRYAYAADTPPGSYGDECRKDYGLKWRPSIHMPRAASRITLEVRGVRVERLQDISAEDALAEGIEHSTMNDPRVEYRWLWEQINGACSWDANPWVWVVQFNRAE